MSIAPPEPVSSQGPAMAAQGTPNVNMSSADPALLPLRQPTNIQRAAPMVSPSPQAKPVLGPPTPSLTERQMDNLVDLGNKSEQNTNEEIKARQSEADAAKAANEAEAAGRAKAAADSEQSMIQSQQNVARAQQEANEADAAAKARAQQVANMKVDPDRKMNELGGLSRIGAAIAMGLGAFGAALTHTQNFAQQIIENAINRDIDAQKEEIANAKDSARALDEISTRKYGRAMTQGQLDAATRLEGYHSALAQVDAQRLKNDSPILQAKADEVKAQLTQKKDEALAGYRSQAFGIQQQAQHSAAMLALAQQRQRQELMQKVYAKAAEYRSDPVKYGTMSADQSLARAAQDMGVGASNMGSVKPEPVQKNANNTKEHTAQIEQAIKDVQGSADEHGAFPGTLPANMPGPTIGKNAREFSGKLDTVASMYLKSIGERITPASQERARKTLFGNGSDEEINAGLERMQGLISKGVVPGNLPTQGTQESAGDE